MKYTHVWEGQKVEESPHARTADMPNEHIAGDDVEISSYR